MKEHIENFLNTKGLDIRCYDTVNSTNTLLKQLAEQGAKEGTVVIAAAQTAGKGRMGRSFYSPQGAGLYMSILLRPRLSPQKSLYITSAAAVAAAGVIEEISGECAEIKWVNDVYLRGKKVCGILTEGSVSDGRLSGAVLGIGVNLLKPAGGYPKELAAIAGAAYTEGDAELLRARTAAGILDRFMGLYETLEEKRFLDEYRRRSMLTGEKVYVYKSADAAPERAQVLGVDDEFSLIVAYADGRTEALSSGEVSVSKVELNQYRF